MGGRDFVSSKKCSARLTALAAVAFAAAAPASAGEAIDWSGLYIGGHAGGAWSDLRWENATLPGGPIHKFNGLASLTGGHVGYQHQFGAWVLGAEATLGGGTFEKQTFDRVSGSAYRTDISWLTTVTGKLGYAVDHWLLSAKAGYAHADISGYGLNGAGGNFRLAGGYGGFTAGASLEYALTSGIIVGAGYDWIDLGSEQRTGVASLGGPVSARQWHRGLFMP